MFESQARKIIIAIMKVLSKDKALMADLFGLFVEDAKVEKTVTNESIDFHITAHDRKFFDLSINKKEDLGL